MGAPLGTRVQRQTLNEHSWTRNQCFSAPTVTPRSWCFETLGGTCNVTTQSARRHCFCRGLSISNGVFGVSQRHPSITKKDLRFRHLYSRIVTKPKSCHPAETFKIPKSCFPQVLQSTNLQFLHRQHLAVSINPGSFLYICLLQSEPYCLGSRFGPLMFGNSLIWVVLQGVYAGLIEDSY